jgi:hypothetical protein
MATDDTSWPIERPPSACRLAGGGQRREVGTAERAVTMPLLRVVELRPNDLERRAGMSTWWEPVDA